MLIIFIACQFVVLVAVVVVVVAGIAEKRAERAHDDNANGVRLCCAVLCCAVLCCVVLGHCLVIGRDVKVLHTSTEGDDVDSQFATGNCRIRDIATTSNM